MVGIRVNWCSCQSKKQAWNCRKLLMSIPPLNIDALIPKARPPSTINEPADPNRPLPDGSPPEPPPPDERLPRLSINPRKLLVPCLLHAIVSVTLCLMFPTRFDVLKKWGRHRVTSKRMQHIRAKSSYSCILNYWLSGSDGSTYMNMYEIQEKQRQGQPSRPHNVGWELRWR